MPTIRIHDWTKNQLQAVREAESHSSYDSVVKALLRDRKLAQAVGEDIEAERDEVEVADAEPEKRFDDLTALAELTAAGEGIMFLWCPNCGNEIAHVTTENPITMSVFETQCQQCLSELNHHAIVTVEIGYPVEEKSVENALKDDLQACVIDYWDRTLARIGSGTAGDVDEEYLVWQLFQYGQTFDWDWPADVPAVALEPGQTYLNRGTEELVTVVESAEEMESGLGPLRVTVRSSDAPPEDATETVLDADELTHLLCNRALYHVDD